jgi:hypothetical protein
MAMAITDLDLNSNSKYPAADPEHEDHDRFVRRQDEFSAISAWEMTYELAMNDYTPEQIAEVFDLKEYDLGDAEDASSALEMYGEETVERFKEASSYSFEEVGALLTDPNF